MTGEIFSIFAEIDIPGRGQVTLFDKIKAAVGYCLGVKAQGLYGEEPNNFVWSCGGFRALCEIKADAVMSRSSSALPPRVMTEEVRSR